MRGVLQVALLLPLAVGNALPHDRAQFKKRPFDHVDDILAGLGSIKQDLMAGGAAINQQLYQATQKPAQYEKCNPSNVQVRQEWSTFSKAEKKEYIRAVQYSYSRWHKDPTKSPLLDGSATSISGQGAKGCSNQTWTGIPSNDQPVIKIPHGQGGGCVTSGPFANFTVNLGPLVPASKCVRPNPDPSGLGYNPRCLMRDINGFTGEGWLKDDDVVSLLHSDNYQTFWEVLQGGPMGNSFANGFMGVHTAGHFIIGGDPAGDFTASPGDPYFFFHHSSIDRLYWIWQNLKPSERTTALYGPTFIGTPTSPNATLNDTLSMGAAYPGPITIEDASSTMGGPFCYIYI
ncbi:hypothetical protein J4E93_000066 [Alternaria ventricosa]|uniref:uncharacterized protein n=1 Tax=Alternaria ventricosa TaxID=1187951 RepID=UPI0020C56F6E|nr:uncharacterized protein J4E93_000066 [Alternaria ventricosa]KAI4655354.1 hypothetical protein J4E93_000066 [Alternaria ventricosa]